MTPDELRALADALEPMAKAPRFEDFDVPAFCAWVRAQADVQPVPAVPAIEERGPWSADREGRHIWIESNDFTHDGRLYVNGDFESNDQRFAYAQEIARRLNAAPTAPAGWKLVPVEPTPEMLSAVGMMDGYDWHAPGCSPDADHANWYSAMIAAAPAAPQAEPIDPHMIAAEDRFPDVPAEQWVTCSQCDGDFDRECPICDGLGKVLATDGEQAEPKPTPASGDDLGVYKGMADSYRNDAEQAEPKREPLTALRILEIEDEATRKWRDNGRLIEYAIVFARMIERAAYERAAQECLATAAELRRCADGCTDGRYDWKADGAADCADAIRALGRQHD